MHEATRERMPTARADVRASTAGLGRRFAASRASTLSLLAITLLDGFATSFCFAPHSLSWMAFIGGTATLLAVRRMALLQAIAASYLYGVAYAVGVAPWVYVALREHYQLGVVTSAAFNLVVVGGGVGFYVGGPFAIWRALVGDTTSSSVPAGVRVLAAPALSFVLELERCRGGISMPWGLVGAGAASSETLRQAVDLFGVSGMSFASVLFSACLCEAIERLPAALRSRVEIRHSVGWALCAALIPLTLLAYGTTRSTAIAAGMRASSARPLRVGLIQPNTVQQERWDDTYVDANVQSLIELSERAARDQRPEILVWPETAVTSYLAAPRSPYRPRLEALAAKYDAHLLVGGPHYRRTPDGANQYFNSIFHIAPGRGVVERYDKRQLLAFGEFDPLHALPVLPRFGTSPREYTPGATVTPFSVGGVSIGALVCFEVLYPNLARENVLLGAELLVNASNDAWFEQTAASAQHVEQARLRAVELRRYLLRVAGTGISAAIDPLGNDVVRPLPVFAPGILVTAVYPRSDLTVYARLGDAPLLCLSAIFVTIAVAVRLRRGGRAKPAPRPAA